MVVSYLGEVRCLLNDDVELIAQRATIQEKGIGQAIASNDERIHRRGALINCKGHASNCLANSKPRRTVNSVLRSVAYFRNFTA
jgi:hypothetical protein